jgi:hypothetical protein
MSSFCIFGVTVAKAAAKADKKVPQYENGNMKPQDEYEAELAEETDRIYKTMKPVQISPGFDAPQFAQQWLELCKKSMQCRAMTMRVRTPKINKHGSEVRSKATGKVLLAWNPYDYKLKMAA